MKKISVFPLLMVGLLTLTTTSSNSANHSSPMITQAHLGEDSLGQNKVFDDITILEQRDNYLRFQVSDGSIVEHSGTYSLFTRPRPPEYMPRAQEAHKREVDALLESLAQSDAYKDAVKGLQRLGDIMWSTSYDEKVLAARAAGDSSVFNESPQLNALTGDTWSKAFNVITTRLLSDSRQLARNDYEIDKSLSRIATIIGGVQKSLTPNCKHSIFSDFDRINQARYSPSVPRFKLPNDK